MARGGMWAVWFGMGLAPAVLSPLAIFVTYKATNDSAVFKIEAYRDFFMHLFGLRMKRHIFGKEVIIEDPDYRKDAEALAQISNDITIYNKVHRLRRLPNFINVFFKYQPDHEIERISNELEKSLKTSATRRTNIFSIPSTNTLSCLPRHIPDHSKRNGSTSLQPFSSQSERDCI